MKRYELVAVAAMILGLGRIADAAGTGSVEGTVVDQMSGQVVPGSKVIVWVVCGSQRRGAAVDEVGHFIVGSLPEGACTVTTGGTTYAAAAVNVTVAADSIATVLVHVMTKAYMENLRKEQEAQMKQMKKMGPLSQIMDMLPGQMGQAARQIDPKDIEKNFKQSEAIINSMTRKERRDPDILNASRRRRIAAGSGMEVQDVNRLIKQFREAQKMMKMFQKTGGKGLGKLFG